MEVSLVFNHDGTIAVTRSSRKLKQVVVKGDIIGQARVQHAGGNKATGFLLFGSNKPQAEPPTT